MKKVLITGSNGFIAKNLIKYILEKNKDLNVFGLNRQKGLSIDTVKLDLPYVDIYADLVNEPCVKIVMEKIIPDIVFHFAASHKNTIDAYLHNVVGTTYLMKYIPEGTRVIYASSSTVYGDLYIHLKEIWEDFGKEHHWEYPKPKCVEDCMTTPTSLYGASKLAGESLIGAQSKIKNLNYVILRYAPTVGPGANFGTLRDVVQKLKSNDEFLELNESLKSYLHIQDAVGAAYTLGFGDASGIFNVAPDTEISATQLVEIAMNSLNIKKEIKMVEGPKEEIALDNTKLKELYQLNFKTSENAVEQSALKNETATENSNNPR